jgi:hypothetical protein
MRILLFMLSLVLLSACGPNFKLRHYPIPLSPPCEDDRARLRRHAGATQPTRHGKGSSCRDVSGRSSRRARLRRAIIWGVAFARRLRRPRVFWRLRRAFPRRRGTIAAWLGDAPCGEVSMKRVSRRSSASSHEQLHQLCPAFPRRKRCVRNAASFVRPGQTFEINIERSFLVEPDNFPAGTLKLRAPLLAVSAPMRLSSGECRFNRVEIRAVGRQEQESCAGVLDRRSHGLVFVAAEVIENDRDAIRARESWRHRRFEGRFMTKLHILARADAT